MISIYTYIIMYNHKYPPVSSNVACWNMLEHLPLDDILSNKNLGRQSCWADDERYFLLMGLKSHIFIFLYSTIYCNKYIKSY